MELKVQQLFVRQMLNILNMHTGIQPITSRMRNALLKIKVLQKVLQTMPKKNHFWFHKEPFSQRFFKEPYFPNLFNNLKNLFSPQRTFMSSYVKGSLWNHLDRKRFVDGIVKHRYFTFMHLAVAFIQSGLQCIQVLHFFVCVFPGN